MKTVIKGLIACTYLLAFLSFNPTNGLAINPQNMDTKNIKVIGQKTFVIRPVTLLLSCDMAYKNFKDIRGNYEHLNEPCVLRDNIFFDLQRTEGALDEDTDMQRDQDYPRDACGSFIQHRYDKNSDRRSNLQSLYNQRATECNQVKAAVEEWKQKTIEARKNVCASCNNDWPGHLGRLLPGICGDYYGEDFIPDSGRDF